jgi:hypothetical protein
VANTMYTAAKEALLAGNINLETDTIKAVLIDLADYTPNFSTHDNLDDVAAGARVGTAQTLTSKTFTNGAFDAADVTFTTVSGDQSEAILVYKDTGVESTSRLLLLMDTATGLPVTPAGGNITIQWNASGIFSL